ncbi:hypothetical protein [Lonepinella koalarum]|uniref:Uncharacterized protein n=1 Tax=Lonepinella koalarum TaxID=53417 RepID=A0A4V2PUI5_9PAST|nr:hypothetical protein [Lonepinella koalarum]MDH2926668.1 hypothetical protein [Lonepinella koalarum]TCK70671.1 hypothetical protein EV692_0960 [Lonepinella koalarum]TFJ89950.1 hypothetical protein E0709_04685 [Lonepinella koalarum]
MSEETTLKQTALLSSIPVLLPVIIECYAIFLQQQVEITYFSCAFLTAQLLCLVVFIKGEICPGQRGRLMASQSLFAIYWLCSGIIGLFGTHQVAILAMSACGLIMTIVALKQPKEDETLRNKRLFGGIIIGLSGVAIYLWLIFTQPISNAIIYSPLAQLFIGVILANFALLISRNRLQAFIALLPFAMSVLLLLNIISVLIFMSITTSQSAVLFTNYFALLVYFISHLVLMAILALHIIRKIKLRYQTLVVLLFIALFLPIWSIFSYVS